MSNQRHPSTQRSLFDAADLMQSRVIARRGEFDELFEGFTQMRAVSHVSSPSLVLECSSGIVVGGG